MIQNRFGSASAGPGRGVDWIKKNASLLPKPIEAAVEKLWAYSSQFGRHLQEGKPANYDEAEMVVGLVAVLSACPLRKAGLSGTF